MKIGDLIELTNIDGEKVRGIFLKNSFPKTIEVVRTKLFLNYEVIMLNSDGKVSGYPVWSDDTDPVVISSLDA